MHAHCNRSKRVCRHVPLGITVAVTLAGASLPAGAQFFDLLKDKAADLVKKQLNATPTPPPGAVPSSGDTPGNGTPPPGVGAGAAASAAAPQTLQAYQNYDFVPGDAIVFEDHFDKDEDGEFPSHWEQLDGAATVNTIGGQRAMAMIGSAYSFIAPAISNTQYLGEAWTIDFDFYPIKGAPTPRLYFYPQTGKATDMIRAGKPTLEIRTGWNGWNDFGLQVVGNNLYIQQPNPEVVGQDSFYGRWHHYAIAYKKGRLKLYLDQYRVYSHQNVGVAPKQFAFISAGEQGKPDVIANLRVASGAGIKIVDKKFTDAKIVTHGINFDTDQATLRPESMGTFNMVADILKNNPALRFEVQGHTDSSGSSAHNLALSQQRADAVRQQLLAMGVEGTRLTAKGLGDSKPIGDNATPEGRANNRRVEFITQK